MSDSSDEEGDELLSDARTKKDLSTFLAKVDEIGDLVHGLVTSTDEDSSSQAIKNADAYLQERETASKTKAEKSSSRGQDWTIINRGPSKGAGDSASTSSAAAPTTDMGEFYKAVEEDARERAEKRKEREKLGKEWKRKGTQAFRRQEFLAAVDNYSQAIKQCPWDTTLYTNLALCHNKLGKFEEAIKACDTALQFESATLRAYIHKGRALMSLKQYKEAESCYQAAAAMELFPEEKEQLEDYLKELQVTQSQLQK